MNARPIVVVTGASRGLGRATAEQLIQNGAAVALVGRRAGQLEQTAGEIGTLGGNVIWFAGDIADPEFDREVLKGTLDWFGRLDALINNAAIVTPLGPAARCSPTDWQYNQAVNLFAPFYLIRSALKALCRTRGRIVNVSSAAAELPIAGASAYCSAKAALEHLTRVVAAENRQVTVLAVRPGVVDTRMQADLRRDAPKFMPAGQAGYYEKIKQDGLLLPPAVPGRVIADLALHAPEALSGRVFNYNDPQIAGTGAAGSDA